MSPDAAAELVGLTVPDPLELASEGKIPGAMLDARGWHFTRKGLETFIARRIRHRHAA